MIELLAIPRTHKYPDEVKDLVQLGIPLNCLPGDERLPLYKKYRMTKVPFSEGGKTALIYTSRKVGRPEPQKAIPKEFSSFTGDVKCDYNPLNDKHLSHFFRTPAHLKILRDLGEITENNNIVCTSKAFNENRENIHRATLDYTHKRINQLEAEQMNRRIVHHAEQIHQRAEEHKAFEYKSVSTVQKRKRQLEAEKRIWANASLDKTESRIEAIKKIKELRELAIQENKLLRNIRIERNIMTSNNKERLRLCSVKGNIYMKTLRWRTRRKQIEEMRQKGIEQKKSRKPVISYKLRLKRDYDERLKLSKEKERLNQERKDLMMIEHAEKMELKHQIYDENPDYRVGKREEILKSRDKQETARALRAQWRLIENEQKLEDIEKMWKRREIEMQQKKILTDLRIKRTFEKNVNMEKKRCCSIKKMIATKSKTMKTVLEKLKTNELVRRQEKYKANHEIATKFRLEKLKYLDKVKKEYEDERKTLAIKHKIAHENMWEGIKNQIYLRTMMKAKKKNKYGMWKQIQNYQRTNNEDEKTRKIKIEKADNNFLDQICTREQFFEVFNAIVDIQNDRTSFYDQNTYIYKAADFLLTNIIKTFEKDLSKDKKLRTEITNRVHEVIDEIRSSTIDKATTIISNNSKGIATAKGKATSKEKKDDRKGSCRQSIGKTDVSFERSPCKIGTSSYCVRPWVELKSVQTRNPTPVGSLTSVIIDGDYPEVVFDATELIFVEHLLIKFKKKLLNGVARKVFKAIEVHKNGGFMFMPVEYLKVNQEYVACRMAESILSYAVNKVNFNGYSLFCINYLATEIVTSLQKQLI